MKGDVTGDRGLKAKAVAMGDLLGKKQKPIDFCEVKANKTQLEMLPQAKLQK